MGFFSELKSDLSQAVNTLMPDDKSQAEKLDGKASEEVNKPVDIDSMLNRLDDLKLDEMEEKLEAEEPVEESFDESLDGSLDGSFGESFAKSMEEPGEDSFEKSIEEPVDKSFIESFDEPIRDSVIEPDEEPVSMDEDFREVTPEPMPYAVNDLDEDSVFEKKIEEETVKEIAIEEPKNAIEAINSANLDRYVEEKNAETEMITNNGGIYIMDFEQQTPSDELAAITEGMIVKGDVATTGSLDLVGKITGNIKCLGKLNITGEINGDSDAAEVYAESARITGEVKSKGSVKIGQSTVIVGNIYGASAVIAGAVKGDIDVHGPVVLDTTAIVMGNIKSQSVQINNGAVIEGMCSQAYADVNPSEFFDGIKNK